MKKSKVGIVTIVDLTNYGNRLQNYAVTHVLEKMGYNPYTICIDKNYTTKTQIKDLIMGVGFVQKLKLHMGKNRSDKHYRYLHFDKFDRANIKKIKVKSMESDIIMSKCSDLQYFVIGSDQVWNPNYGYAREYDFAQFAKPEQRVCFSPSFGIDEMPEANRECVSNGLKEMKNISVREESGRDIVKNLTGRDATVLIDPTMMLDAEEWSKVAYRPDNIDMNTGYIFGYFLGKRTEEQDARIKKMMNDYNLKFYDIMDKTNRDLYVTGPGEFISLVENARLIVTDSFHASVFSILFKKPFIVFQRDGNGAGISSRLDTLLGKFQLTSRFEYNLDDSEVMNCDFTEAYKILGEERKKVNEFLEKSMQ